MYDMDAQFSRLLLSWKMSAAAEAQRWRMRKRTLMRQEHLGLCFGGLLDCRSCNLTCCFSLQSYPGGRNVSQAHPGFHLASFIVIDFSRAGGLIRYRPKPGETAKSSECRHRQCTSAPWCSRCRATDEEAPAGNILRHADPAEGNCTGESLEDLSPGLALPFSQRAINQLPRADINNTLARRR